MTITYSDSAYRFTDPIRLYKANDPYYFEVDNIPLKQLQENCNWLKDQLTKLSGNFTGGLRRKAFDELRPYANGDDRVIRVKPGIYTSRINDATNRDALAVLEQIGNTSNSEQGFDGPDEWRSTLLSIGETGAEGTLYAALEKFKSTVAADALGCDGLIGRCWTWPTYSETDPADPGGVGVALIDQPFHDQASLGYSSAKLQRLIFPILRVSGWKYTDESGIFNFVYGGWRDDFYGYTFGPAAEVELLKKWRGVARNAVVSVDEELTIEVPPFDANDFNVTNQDGDIESVNGVTSRIDMIFIYSKPIDRKGTTILNQYQSEYITKPKLGIVQGAGIKVNQSTTGTGSDNERQETTTDTHKMLASPGDQFNESMGFTATSGNDITYDVRGSFPAPDDILNLAPLISDKLESTAYELIGQTILPVAYVWVRGTSEGIQQSVLSTDVIDIRPFFRTAELAYNERTGIAAAVPQLSIANPAVGKGQLDRTAENLKNYVNARVESVNTQTSQTQKTLATGYVFGGWAFGPEAALLNYYSKQQPGATTAEIADVVSTKYGLGQTENQSLAGVPYFPDWDFNTIVRSGNSSVYTNQSATAGTTFNRFLRSYITTFQSQNGPTSNISGNTGADESIAAGSLKNKIDEGNLNFPLSDQTVENNFLNAESYDHPRSRVRFNYVRKKIRFDRPAEMRDYFVDAQLVNCIPMTYPGYPDNLNSHGAYTGVWIEKGYDYFVVYVGYAVDSITSTGNAGFIDPANISDDGRLAGFSVVTEDIELSNPTAIPLTPGSNGRAGYTGNPRMGKCALPTVMWSLTGISNNGSSFFYPNLGAGSGPITLDSF
jgi:hypothetical protein